MGAVLRVGLTRARAYKRSIALACSAARVQLSFFAALRHAYDTHKFCTTVVLRPPTARERPCPVLLSNTSKRFRLLCLVGQRGNIHNPGRMLHVLVVSLFLKEQVKKRKVPSNFGSKTGWQPRMPQQQRPVFVSVTCDPRRPLSVRK